MILTVDELRAWLHYDEASGMFTWLKKPNRKVVVGSVAGTLSHGYVQIRVKKRSYKAHRLAWLFVHGQWPTDEIDHWDRNRANNAIRNLRPATSGQNKQNLTVRSDNASGITGVDFRSDDKVWRVRIQFDGHVENVGRFDCLLDAAAARFSAERKFHSHTVQRCVY